MMSFRRTLLVHVINAATMVNCGGGATSSDATTPPPSTALNTGLYDHWRFVTTNDIMISGNLVTITEEHLVHFTDGTQKTMEYSKICSGPGFLARQIGVVLHIDVTAVAVQLTTTAASWDLDNICSIQFNFTANLPYTITDDGAHLNIMTRAYDRVY